jgi:hypothetical protein
MSEVDRFAQVFRMLGYRLEDFQREIVAEAFSPRPELLVLIPRANGSRRCSPRSPAGACFAAAVLRSSSVRMRASSRSFVFEAMAGEYRGGVGS